LDAQRPLPLPPARHRLSRVPGAHRPRHGLPGDRGGYHAAGAARHRPRPRRDRCEPDSMGHHHLHRRRRHRPIVLGVLSDRFGRRRVLLTGLTLYVLAAAAVGMARTFEALLAWRFAHGVAAASMVISRSVIRDLYGGRQMARVMSLTFIVFIMVPII